MTTRWFVARYLPDLRRREPRNIGVILFADGRAYHRFVGDDPSKPEGINGHVVKGHVASVENYKGWVNHWRSAASEVPAEQLLERRADDSYYIERGGFLLAGEEGDPRSLLDELFVSMVSTPATKRVEESPDAMVGLRAAFDTLSAECSVEPSFVLDLKPDKLLFQFKIEVGKERKLYRAVKLNHNPERTWGAVHDAIYSILKVDELGLGDAYALLVTTDPGDEVEEQRSTLAARLGKRALDADHDALGVVRRTLQSNLFV